ncbi:MAG TPA: hemerythrin domain-containing protein [Chitinophagaceae bacterium]|nr:hemerythrin domain-containing protein [Chitinophagaceae bacterium]
MEDQKKPIKRHNSLQPLSREHHHTLLLVWKIRKAIKDHVALERVDQYVSWFYQQYVLPHFEMEEKFIYPVLGEEHELIVQALNEHKKLKGYFEAKGKDEIAYAELADLLEKHIRFEERTLFNVIQALATEQQLSAITVKHGTDLFEDNEADPFWK